MKSKMNRFSMPLLVFVLSAALILLTTLPLRNILAAANITDIRFTTALTPVIGLLFGIFGALGCATGNLISDIASGYETMYILFGFFQQIIYGMVPYYLWRKLNTQHDGNEFRLDSLNKILKFCLVIFIDAVLMVVSRGLMNNVFSISDFFSMNNLYIFINYFDIGLLFGCPAMIAGNLLQNYLNHLKDQDASKVMTFSLNERMIINTIITGLGISFLIGLAVYLSDKMSIEESVVSLGGRIFLFETFALNFYFALSIGFMWFTEKKISKPVEHLAEIAGNYYEENSTETGRQHLISACETYAKDTTEVGNLARSYISMVKDLDSYVENLQKITAEKERINAELTLASSIQAHMLPCIFPPFPDHDEFDIYATMTPAKEVGGDFYDFFMVDDTHLAVVMADVSGKGVPAALFMVIAKTLIKNYAQMGLPPSEVFTTVNALLCEGNDAGLFVTAWLGVLDLVNGKLTYVNAGHNPPLLMHQGDSFEYLKCHPGFVLAGLETVKYRQKEIELQPKDRLFLYTDGITEATDIKNQLYGEERLQSYLNQHRQDSLYDTLYGLEGDIDAFVGEAEQFDDMTMLILEVKKRKSSLTEKIFPAKDEVLPEVLNFIENELEKIKCSKKTIMAISVVIEEVFVNIAHYAYKEESGHAKVGFGFDEATHMATFKISDQGIPFDPLKKEDPDITLSAEEREKGGLGILMIKKMMDTVSYCYENNENVLTITKKIDSEEVIK